MLNAIIVIAGAFIMIYNFFEIRVWGGLYFDRTTLCAERLRSLTQACDLVSVWHSASKSAFGIAMVMSGVNRWVLVPEWGLVNGVYVASAVMLLVDVFVMGGVTRARKLREVRAGIEEQWKKQKRLSHEHNHEVNLHRGTVRVTESYPRQIAWVGVGLILLRLIAF